MRYIHEELVREIAHGMLVGSQFQHFIPEVAVESSPTTAHTHVSSPAYYYHLEEMDHSYPVHVAGTSQAGPSQYSPLHCQSDTRTPLTIVGGVGDQLSWIR